MPRTCRSGRHRPAALIVWNCGLRFSTCERCGQDILSGGNEVWALPPKGTRVSWRSDPPPSYLIPQARLESSKPRRGMLDLRPVRSSSKAMRWTGMQAIKAKPQAPAPLLPKTAKRRRNASRSRSTALVIWKPGLLGLATVMAFFAFRLRWRP